MDHITVEKNVGAVKPSQIRWPLLTPKALDIIQLAAELESDYAMEQISDHIAKRHVRNIQEDNYAQRELILLAIELVKEQHKVDSDGQSRPQCYRD